MTDLLSRPILRVPQPVTGPDRPVTVAAPVAAAAVALAGLMLCLAVATAGWFAADVGSFPQALSLGALGWLVGNGAGLTGPGVDVTVVPLGFVLLCGVALYRAGRWAASTSRIDGPQALGTALLAMVAAYVAPAGLVSLFVGVGGVHAPLPRTVLVCAGAAVVFGGIGLLRGSGLLPELIARVPEELRAAGVGAAAGVLSMVAAGALVFLLAMVAHLSTALRLAESLDAGVVGGLLLSVVGVLLVPNAAVFGAAYAAGPGFALGTGTQVSPSGVHVGLLPDFPMLAAVPTGNALWWLPGLIAVPVIAGAFAGVVAVRRYPVFAIDRAAMRGALAGLIGAFAFVALCAAATGSLAPGRLHVIGPDVAGTALVCLVAFVLGGSLAAATHRLVAGWRADRRA